MVKFDRPEHKTYVLSLCTSDNCGLLLMLGEWFFPGRESSPLGSVLVWIV